MKADKLVGSKMLRKFLRNRKGTAEVIGSVMFIVILLFFFTNVYLWHDAATKEMNNLQVQKMNAGMTANFNTPPYTITAQGSGVMLSRIWVVTYDNQHYYVNLEDSAVPLIAGQTITLIFNSGSATNGEIQDTWTGNTIYVHFNPDQVKSISVLNTLGVLV